MIEQIEGRNIAEANRLVSDMSDDEIALYAKHDPDLFRHIARAAIVNRSTPSADAELVKRLRQDSDDCMDNYTISQDLLKAANLIETLTTSLRTAREALRLSMPFVRECKLMAQEESLPEQEKVADDFILGIKFLLDPTMPDNEAEFRDPTTGEALVRLRALKEPAP